MNSAAVISVREARSVGGVLVIIRHPHQDHGAAGGQGDRLKLREVGARQKSGVR